MSLFKSREWWSEKCGNDETFGAQHMCIASYNGDDGVKNVILVGSMEGYLRIYSPTPPPRETSSSSDLLLETQLALPILSVQAIRFNNTEGLHVAVLHPWHLRTLRVVIIESTEVNSHCTVDFMYEHRLPLHGYTLVVGPFWQCVQSLTEGTLMFFENERVGMVCKLPALHLLPSPMCYVSTTESFIICDSAWHLHSFNYQSLANSSLENRVEGSSNKLLSDWQLELCEPALDIQTDNSFIVVLSEKHLYCLNDNGSVEWTRKLDYHPLSLTVLTPPSSPESVVVLTCSDANTLLVYKNNIVEWNCKLPFSPVVIQTGTFHDVQGLIVTLSADGQLNVSFMGTQQVQYGFLQAPQRPFNYVKGRQDIEKLTQSLRLGNKQNMSHIPKGDETEIVAEFEKDLCTEYVGTEQMTVDGLRCQLKIATFDKPKSDVRVFIHCDSAIVATPSESTIQLDHEGCGTLSLLFHATHVRSIMAASLSVDISILNSLSGGHSITKQIILPLRLITRLATPVREAIIKITLSTNQPVVPLAQLFRDFPVEDSAMSNVIAFAYSNGPVVSILASKTTNKYRIQSDSLAVLALFVPEIQKRLQAHFAESPTFRVLIESPLPLEETWQQIETHFGSYNDLKKGITNLGQASCQFHIIQRLFHNKILYAKTVDSTIGIFSALQLAHNQIIHSIQNLEKLEKTFKNETNQLEGAIQCLLSLLNIGNGNTKTCEVQMLGKLLIPVEQLHLEKSWQETVDNKLCYLAKNQSIPNNLGLASVSATNEFRFPWFKKKFFQVFEFVSN